MRLLPINWSSPTRPLSSREGRSVTPQLPVLDECGMMKHYPVSGGEMGVYFALFFVTHD